jgi:hypothetical protein
MQQSKSPLRNVIPTDEDLAIGNECGNDFEIKRIVSCRIVVVGRTYYRKYQ